METSKKHAKGTKQPKRKLPPEKNPNNHNMLLPSKCPFALPQWVVYPVAEELIRDKYTINGFTIEGMSVSKDLTMKFKIRNVDIVHDVKLEPDIVTNMVVELVKELFVPASDITLIGLRVLDAENPFLEARVCINGLKAKPQEAATS